jgi:hypothetical protein
MNMRDLYGLTLEANIRSPGRVAPAEVVKFEISLMVRYIGERCPP